MSVLIHEQGATLGLSEDRHESRICRIGANGQRHGRGLLKAGHEVIVYNRTPAKAGPLIAQGARAVASIADACREGAVITMLANDNAVEGVVLGKGGIIDTLPKGGIHISSSTISVALSEALATAHAKAGQRFVAAPVFGRPDVAAGGQLFVVAAGSADASAAATPLFDAIGQKTFVVSETLKAANLVKLSGNFLIAVVIEFRRARPWRSSARAASAGTNISIS